MQLLVRLVVARLDPLLLQPVQNHFRPRGLHPPDEALVPRQLEEAVVCDGDAVEEGGLGVSLCVGRGLELGMEFLWLWRLGGYLRL